jgi:hypothetical protein
MVAGVRADREEDVGLRSGRECGPVVNAGNATYACEDPSLVISTWSRTNGVTVPSSASTRASAPKASVAAADRFPKKSKLRSLSSRPSL